MIGERFAGDQGNLRLNQSKVLLSQAAGASQTVTATSHPKMDRLLQVWGNWRLLKEDSQRQTANRKQPIVDS